MRKHRWVLAALVATTTYAAPVVVLGGDGLERVELSSPALFPETVVYDAGRDRFLVGSMRAGAIFEVTRDGRCRKVFDDERLKSTLGLAIDPKADRLFALTSDLGVSVRTQARSVNQRASLEIFELATGKHTRSVDLSALVAGRHLANALALDLVGNAYVTDSFSPVIYRVDPQGRASVFLESARFTGQGVNLNGIVFHPDGYLLVVKKSDGVLFKVPLDDPKAFSEVATPNRFLGGDGLLLVTPTELVVVANRTPSAQSDAVFSVVSDDGWASATLAAQRSVGDVYPTSAVVRDGKVFVLHSQLGELLKAAPAQQAHVQPLATLEQVGTVRRVVEPITRTLLGTRPMPDQPGWELRQYLVEYAPGAAAPVHHHPFQGVGFVLSGRFESAFGDGPVSSVGAGQAFVEFTGAEHRLFRNPDASAPLRFVLVYALPVGRAPIEY